MSIIDNLNKLETDIVNAKQTLVDNINSKGVSVSVNSTLTEIANSVLDIPQEGGGGGGGIVEGIVTDWGAIGYEEAPEMINTPWTYAKQIYDNWDASIGDRYNAFSSDSKLIYFPNVNMSNVTSTYNMFSSCRNLTLFPKVTLTSKLTKTNSMFYDCQALQDIDVSQWDVSNVTEMTRMFASSRIKSFDGSMWDTSKCKNFSELFNSCYSLQSVKLDGWNFNSTKDYNSTYGPFYAMFTSTALTEISLSNVVTDQVSSMYGMFSGATKVTSLDLSSFDTRNVTTFKYMFNNCSGLTSLDLSSFDTPRVDDMSNMFQNCRGLTSLDVSSFDTSNVTTLYYTFGYCSGLTSLDLSSWNTSNCTNVSYMFYQCHNLQKVEGSLDWSKISSYPSTFYQSNSTYGYKLRYLTIKNLGTTGTSFNFNQTNGLQNWGDESDTTTYPLSVGARQTLVDSLLTYSYDRAANGMSTCAISLPANVKARLTSEEIAAITLKGYSIA